jgi:hypothetical protein
VKALLVFILVSTTLFFGAGFVWRTAARARARIAALGRELPAPPPTLWRYVPSPEALESARDLVRPGPGDPSRPSDADFAAEYWDYTAEELARALALAAVDYRARLERALAQRHAQGLFTVTYLEPEAAAARPEKWPDAWPADWDGHGPRVATYCALGDGSNLILRRSYCFSVARYPALWAAYRRDGWLRKTLEETAHPGS